MAKNRIDPVTLDHYLPHLSGGDRKLSYSPRMVDRTVLTNMYTRLLLEVACTRFEWHGLPDSVDERYLELLLVNHGSILFFEWERPIVDGLTDPRFMVQPFTGRGDNNAYNNPTLFDVNNFEIRGTYDSQHAVPIYANYLRTPETDIVWTYAARLANIDTTFDVTLDNLRTPYILVMDEESRLTFENIERQRQEGIPTIKVRSDITGNYQSLPTGAHHETVPALLASKGKIWNEALTMLGVPAVNQDKKERVISDEVDSAKDQSIVIRNTGLHSRETACEQINRLWPDLTVSVTWRAEAAARAMTMFGLGEDEDHGDFHDDTSADSGL